MLTFGKLAFLALTAATLCVELAIGAPVTEPDSEKRQVKGKFPYGTEKVRGVNLGGWFVLEPFITPSIFEATGDPAVVDEYTLTQHYGKHEAHIRLWNHWNTWYTEQDFADMAAAGLNHVRIPIGYWSIVPIAGEPYTLGAYPFLTKALTWAYKHGLKAMIDLHGAPGSQNGFDNSGHRGAILWTTGDTIAQTHAALNKLRDDHAKNPAVASIQLVNEPMGPQLDMTTIRNFYYDGYNALKNSPVTISIHNAFQPDSYWNDWGVGLPRVLLDTHHYEVFDSGSLAMTTDQHVASACGFAGEMQASTHTIIAGEWSAAMTDCAMWLNGRGVGARYDGTYNYNGQTSSYIGYCGRRRASTVDALSASYKNDMRRFIEAQLDAYETRGGWIFWTWHTEHAPEWNMQQLLGAGVFPQPLTARKYPGQCG